MRRRTYIERDCGCGDEGQGYGEKKEACRTGKGQETHCEAVDGLFLSKGNEG